MRECNCKSARLQLENCAIHEFTFLQTDYHDYLLVKKGGINIIMETVQHVQLQEEQARQLVDAITLTMNPAVDQKSRMSAYEVNSVMNM